MLRDKISTLKLTAPLSVESGTSVGQVLEQVQRRDVGCVAVCQGGILIGVMTERDVLMKIVARDVDYKEPVDQFMTPQPLTLTPDKTIGDAVNMMNEHNFRHVPIIDAQSNRPVAIFSIKDVINMVAESFPEQVLNLPPRPHQKMETPEGA